MLTKGAGRGGCLSRRGLSPHGQAYCIDVEVDLGREATVMSGQNPVAESPFCARSLVMCANDGAIDHLKGIWDSPALVQALKDVFP